MIADIIKKFNLKRNSYYLDGKDPYKNVDRSTYSLKEDNLRKTWSDYVKEKWYGILIGNPVPEVWLDAINKALDYLLYHNPNMKILQIKIKFGGIRIYLEGIDGQYQQEVYGLEWVLFDEKLIY